LGQIEVYQFLKDRRAAGDNSFISVAGISNEIKTHQLNNINPRGVRSAVCTLEAYGYLDVKKPGKRSDFRRLFRLKKKYLK
jgi:hypothetical protein